jgi:DNA invertase Pin-like site-specific DNA recombinase
MYCRKSTDSEDRQVQSIADQKRELQTVIERFNLNVVKVFEESMSAKSPGRPVFNEMMQMVNSGEAEGILCWKLNRLSRNPIDGGQIQWQLQNGIIQSIITPSREYLPTDNVLMMSVELGMATQYSIDLSKDVKRGMDSKVTKGWRPGRAPLGYLNDKYGEKGETKIFID